LTPQPNNILTLEETKEEVKSYKSNKFEASPIYHGYHICSQDLIKIFREKFKE
jgi:hypothetical protein